MVAIGGLDAFRDRVESLLSILEVVGRVSLRSMVAIGGLGAFRHRADGKLSTLEIVGRFLVEVYGGDRWS